MNNYQYNNNNSFSLKELFKTNPLTIVLVYLIVYIFGTLLVSLIVSEVYANIKNLSLQEVFNCGLAKPEDVNKQEIFYNIQTYTNFFTYMLLFITIPFFSRDYLKEDLSIFKDYKRVIIIIICAILFMLISKGLSDLSSLIIDKMGYSDLTSQNEDLILKMCENGAKGLVVVSTVFFAPIVEELVYRKALIKLSERITNEWNKKVLEAIVNISLSALIFALPHMLSSQNYPVSVWIVLFMVYFISGALLASIYYFNKKNIYASTLAHTLNNLYAIMHI